MVLGKHVACNECVECCNGNMTLLPPPFRMVVLNPNETEGKLGLLCYAHSLPLLIFVDVLGCCLGWIQTKYLYQIFLD